MDVYSKALEKKDAAVELIKERPCELPNGPRFCCLLKKKKTDKTYKLLHAILLRRKAKAFKSNIAQFSGFTWHENEVKRNIHTQRILKFFLIPSDIFFTKRK
ncbi:hypothetical protein MKX01_016646 [Papaver californicum]|nr:hypothetical protein MKX01_016646 [Papaver californicum]